MDPGTIGSLFRKFSRAADVQTNVEGTGLGLYVVAQLVAAHGGRVWAESKGVDKGSTFFVQVPAV
jgi:signal transduction histidine kinase